MARMNVQVSRVAQVISVLCVLLLRTTAGFSAAPAAQGPAKGTLTVKVVGARNTKGKIGVTLIQDGKSFATTLQTRSAGRVSRSTPAR
jgi:uncharacterized protein (DUF2141 family)